MHRTVRALVWAVLVWGCAAISGQDAKPQNAVQIVQQAVNTELAADAADHSRWLFYDIDNKPNASVRQWVAQTANGSLHRVLERNGQTLTREEQLRAMQNFAQNSGAQVRQRKGGQHDDHQATQMLRLLPQAFVWKVVEKKAGHAVLDFTPDPNFHPPTYESRVFAAMEGEMTVDNAQHRIASLKGRMIHDVKFGYGLFGDLRKGGTFDVERRQLKPGIWQITETHVHIQGRALLFKSISDQEDDEKSEFTELPANLSFGEAEQLLMKQHT